MPFTPINGVCLHYRTLGTEGPWICLVSGARRSMEEVCGVSDLIVRAGFRVLLHDRRNTGQSGLSLDGDGSEFDIWADDLHALIQWLGLPPVIVGGSSSGCRLATILALRHRSTIRALVMMRVTGGAFAVQRLAGLYYTQYLDAAQRGGLAEVCKTDHFRDLVAADPLRRDEIMRWDVAQFSATFERWRSALEAGAEDPMLGATAEALRSIDFPVCVMPGNDRTHSIEAGHLVRSLIPGAELHELRTDQLQADLISLNEWAPDAQIAEIIVDFARRVTHEKARSQA